MAAVLIAPVALGFKANSWQGRLDKALLSVELDPRARMRLLQRALRDPALQADVREAGDIIRNQGFGKGHPAVIEKLWPTGTTARADLEALTALRKQVPEALEELRKQGPPQPGKAADASPPPLPDPKQLVDSLVSLASDSEKQKELQEEALDLLRRTPKNLETPKYKVMRALDGPMFLGQPEPIELRAYEAFTVARTEMDGAERSAATEFGFGSRSSAKGFNTLASYLFGKNSADQAMAMTMPVEVSETSMAFVLPKKNAEEPPQPLAGSDVTISEVPARLVAVKAFSGFVTEQEVKRQKTALLEVLAAEGSGVAPVEASEVSVLQYNSPLTVPWRRRNEVAIVVEEVTPVAATDAEADAATDADSEGVVSWYDSGVRL